MPRQSLEPGETGRISPPKKVKDGVWEARAYFRDVCGDRQRARVTGRNQSIAEKNLKKYIAARIEESAAAPDDLAAPRPELVTVADAVAAWLATLPALRRSETTVAEYACTARGDILPSLGDVRLDDLRLGALIDWRASIADGTAPQREVGPGERHGLMKRVADDGTVSWVLKARRPSLRQAEVAAAILRQALDFAVVDHALQSNPLRHIPPLEPPERVDPEAPTPEQTQTMLREVDAWSRRKHPGPRWDTFGVYVAVLATTGCRPQEVLALRWCDVDLTPGLEYVTVTGTVVVTTGRGAWRKDAPKSRHGKRRLVLLGWVAEMVRDMRPEGAALTHPLFPSSSPGYLWRAPAAVRQKFFAVHRCDRHSAARCVPARSP